MAGRSENDRDRNASAVSQMIKSFLALKGIAIALPVQNALKNHRVQGGVQSMPLWE